MNDLNCDDETELKAAFATAATAIKSPPGLRDKIRSHLFTAGLDSSPCSNSTRSRRFLRRCLAVAATIVVVALTAVAFRWDGTEFTSVAFADFDAALSKIREPEWIHYREGNREFWLSFQPYRQFERHPDGVWARDRVSDRSYRYDRTTKALTIEHIGRPDQMETLGSFAEFMRRKINSLTEEGKTISKGTEAYQGKNATVYVVTGFRENEGGKWAVAKYFLDPASDRVLGFEGGLGFERLYWPLLHIPVDYPAEGPHDIYDVGVPRDAKVVDKMPPPVVLDLAAKIEAAANAEPAQFCEFSVQIRESFARELKPNFGIWVEVTYAQAGRLRRDRFGERTPADYEQALSDLAAFRKNIQEGGLPALESWLKLRKPTQIIIGSRRSERLNIFRLDSVGRVQQEGFCWNVMWPVLGRPDGRPSVPLNDVTETLSGVGINGLTLVGLGNKTNKWFFAPERDYVFERTETKLESNQVLEYAKTDAGRWYVQSSLRTLPKGQGTELAINFRDDQREVDPSIFDESKVTPANLAPEESSSQ